MGHRDKQRLKLEFHKHFKLKATLSTQETAQGAAFHNDRTTWLRHVCQMKKKDKEEKQHIWRCSYISQQGP